MLDKIAEEIDLDARTINFVDLPKEAKREFEICVAKSISEMQEIHQQDIAGQQRARYLARFAPLYIMRSLRY